MYQSLKKRIEKQGLVATVLYVVTVFILPKIGIDIKTVYKKDTTDFSSRLKLSPDVSIKIVRNLSEINEADLGVLHAFEGDQLISRMKNDFKEQRICTLIKCKTNGLVGLAWLEPLYDEESFNEKTYLSRDRAVFPQFRGKGYSPNQAVKAYSQMQNLFPDKTLSFLANIYIGNKSSINSAKKSGFKYFKTDVRLFRRWDFTAHRA